MSQREYWSEAMEKRYKRRRLELWPKLPLKGQIVSKIFFAIFDNSFYLWIKSHVTQPAMRELIFGCLLK